MISLALLWHQHQPLYKDPAHPTPEGSYCEPWVRLHALRDYYSMAALVAEHPGVHLTINLTPALLWQIEDYTERGATDQSLELTRTPVASLDRDQREEILASFFDADWHNQIFPHPRYKELFEQRSNGCSFTEQDLRDLEMWFNLAWFGREFREGEVELVTGETASVQRFVGQGRGFSRDDIHAMIEEQYKIMRAVIPLHRTLQDREQIEVSTTPFYHPILPLLIDTDQATVDRPGTALPERFSFPEDAEAQVARAVEKYREWFGQAPQGMWPAEGAVSQSSIPLFADNDVSWIATDQGVLARSGRWGYEVDQPNVLCRPYRAEEDGSQVSIFFRDTVLSDAIGFHYHGFSDYGEAARDFVHRMKAHCARHDRDDQVHTVILDGENAWGAYREDARPFLHASTDSWKPTPRPGRLPSASTWTGIRPATFRPILRIVRKRSTTSLPARGSTRWVRHRASIWARGLVSPRRIGPGSCSAPSAKPSTRKGPRPKPIPTPSRHSTGRKAATGSGGLERIRTRATTRRSTISSACI
jgi:alpha-amylase/alpha-mannosidase (GH57 family)